MDAASTGCTELSKESLNPRTVGQVFTEEIQRSRKRVEDLCIAKAKAETLNLINQPYEGIRAILGWVI